MLRRGLSVGDGEDWFRREFYEESDGEEHFGRLSSEGGIGGRCGAWLAAKPCRLGGSRSGMQVAFDKWPPTTGEKIFSAVQPTLYSVSYCIDSFAYNYKRHSEVSTPAISFPKRAAAVSDFPYCAADFLLACSALIGCGFQIERYTKPTPTGTRKRVPHHPPPASNTSPPRSRLRKRYLTTSFPPCPPPPPPAPPTRPPPLPRARVATRRCRTCSITRRACAACPTGRRAPCPRSRSRARAARRRTAVSAASRRRARPRPRASCRRRSSSSSRHTTARTPARSRGGAGGTSTARTPPSAAEARRSFRVRIPRRITLACSG